MYPVCKKLIAVLVPLIIMSQQCSSYSEQRCRDRLGSRSVSENHESMYQIPVFRHTWRANNRSTIHPDFINISRSNLSGLPTVCPTWEQSRTFFGGKLCPWHYVMNYDSNRIPSYMAEAWCNCPECISDSQSSSMRDCQPILYYTRVCRKSGFKNGVYTYRIVWEPLQVGCQCAEASSVQSAYVY